MENGPDGDFEMLFYSGWKMVKTNVSLLVTEPHGQTSTWQLNGGEPQLDRESVRELWHHLKECQSHCERIEASVNQLVALPISNGSLPFFPLTIGRKPVASPASTTKLSLSNKENVASEPVLSGLKSFDGSVRSVASNNSKSSSGRRIDNQTPATISRTVDVPGIGRAIQKSSGNYICPSFNFTMDEEFS